MKIKTRYSNNFSDPFVLWTEIIKYLNLSLKISKIKHFWFFPLKKYDFDLPNNNEKYSKTASFLILQWF